MLLVLSVLCGLAAPAAYAGPHWRMDPSERERLRHDLREQPRVDRGRHHDEWRSRAAPPAGAYAPAPGYPPAPPGAPPAHLRDGPGGGPMPPAFVHERRDPYVGPGPGPEGGRPRMSPEEREQLRMMLRERRRQRD